MVLVVVAALSCAVSTAGLACVVWWLGSRGPSILMGIKISHYDDRRGPRGLTWARLKSAGEKEVGKLGS